MTLTSSKVKVKVTGLLKFRKLHFCRSVFSAFWRGAQNWWLIMIVRDLACLSPIFEFHSQKSILAVHKFQMAISAVTWLGTGSPICNVHTNMTLTSSKVNVKILDLHFPKLDYSTSTSSAIFALRSLMGNYDSMGPSLQLFGSRFLKFSPLGGHVTSKFAKCWYHQNPLRFILSLIHIWRCRRSTLCRSRWSPYH